MRIVRLAALGTVAAGSAALVLAVSGPAFAAPRSGGYPVVPGVYDPGHTGGASAGWVTGIGEPDAGNSAHALVLTKTLADSGDAAGYANLERVAGTTWQDELGFDYKDGSLCGDSGPRFDVYDSQGNIHFFVCGYGTQTSASTPGWTQVRFTEAQGEPPIPPGTSISSIVLVQDQQGTAVLDNIYYNGQTMGKPGS